MALITDLETIAKPKKDIEATWGEELRNPVMPDEIANPAPFDESKCPDYGATAAAKAFEKLEGERSKKAGDSPSEKWTQAKEKLDGLIAKQVEWHRDKRAAWTAKTEGAKAKWQAGIDAAREKSYRDAALEARTAEAKLFVVRDTMESEAIIFLWEVTPEVIAALTAEEFVYRWKEGSVPKTCVCDLRIFATEAAMLKAYLSELARRYASEKALEDAAAVVGYYIKEFDFPFTYRRAWMNGVPGLPLFMRGRYWSEDVLDLHELFAFGHREYRVGGLDGLGEALGCGGSKLGDGAGFGEWYARNPVEGVQYCINDVQLTEEAGRKMGALK